MAKKAKRPTFAETIKHVKEAKRASRENDSDAYKQMAPSWRIKSIDDGWDYGWSKIGQKRWKEDVLPRLADWETMTCSEILSATYGENNKSSNHFISKENFIPVAQNRLEDIGLGDLDALLSLRLQGKYRIYGFLQGHTMHILWFDFDHALVKSEKKHT